MNRPTWEQSFVNNGTPVGGILIPAAWVFAHHVEDLYDFSDGEFAPGKRHFLEV